jgi:Mrp family chromosome partitioning ATPase
MTTIFGLLAEAPIGVEQPRAIPVRERVGRAEVSSAASVGADLIHDQQINALVQQLFFRRESAPTRHVGFVTVDASTDSAALCLQVASAVAEDDRYDVGLVDASTDSLPLETQLGISTPSRTEATWAIGPHLWMVPRQSWLPDHRGSDNRGLRVTSHNLLRLRELTEEFDFSILRCAQASWLTASIGQSCDGLVLVLNANKTRRIVATQIKDQLRKAQVPLLGTVLANRQFPVPQGLYRSL